MLSIPPATIISASPKRILCAACAMAFIPLAHTLFTVVAITLSGKPANLDACRAGAWPVLACITQPIKTSCTSSGLMPAFSTAAFIATAPSCGAVKSFKLPPKLPMAVRTAETI